MKKAVTLSVFLLIPQWDFGDLLEASLHRYGDTPDKEAVVERVVLE